MNATRDLNPVNIHRLFLAATMVLAAPPLAAQQLTLAGALARAETTAYANRTATSGVAAERARTLGTLQGIVPTVRVESGVATTTDPLGAFAFALRQRTVTAAAFSPAAINDPSARSNWSAAVVAEMPLLNADAWAGRNAALAGSRATAAGADWTRVQTRLQVVQAYYSARLASELVLTIGAAAATAEARVHEVRARHEQGLVTRSDLLLAQLRAGEIDAQLIGARAEVQLTRQELARVLGTPRDTVFSLPDSLPSPEHIRVLAGVLAAAPFRCPADVAAAQATSDAAARDLMRATTRLLPRLNSFARYDWNDHAAPFRGNGSWTLGVLATWTPFSGFAEVSDMRGAHARASAANTMLEAVEAEAALRRAASERAVTVALARLAIAEQAVDQGSEAHRLVARQYAGGLAGITELLGAQAIETQTRLGLAQARVALIIAITARQLARGSDPAAIAALER